MSQPTQFNTPGFSGSERHQPEKLQQFFDRIKDDGRRLALLTDRLQANLTASGDGPPSEQSAVPNHPGFQWTLSEKAHLEGRLLESDAEIVTLRAEIVTLRTENTTLRAEDATRRAEDATRRAEDATRRIWNEFLQQEVQRTRHTLERVEAERDRSRSAADYAIDWANDLERRLQEIEILYQGNKRSLDLLTGAGSQQGHTTAHQAVSAPAGLGAWPTRDITMPRTEPQKEHESRQLKPVESGSETKTSFHTAIEDSEKDGNTTGEEAPRKNGDASVEKPVAQQMVTEIQETDRLFLQAANST